MDKASWLAGTVISLADIQQRPAASQTRRISIVAGTERHIATLQAFYDQPADDSRAVPPLGLVIDRN